MGGARDITVLEFKHACGHDHDVVTLTSKHDYYGTSMVFPRGTTSTSSTKIVQKA